MELSVMNMTVFSAFINTPYTFLRISRGGVRGNEIVESYDALGVFKLREGMVSVGNQESRESSATLHIKPDESFLADVIDDGKLELVGHGVRVNNVEYEILGSTGGNNFETNVLEHYRVTLAVADFAEETS